MLWAKDGREAVEKCKSEKNIDLVLMDIKLPEIDGYRATQMIKKFRKDLVIIALTAYASETDMAESLKAGCDDHLSKPVQHEKLLSMIKKYM